jgi:hypothetical protein
MFPTRSPCRHALRLVQRGCAERKPPSKKLSMLHALEFLGEFVLLSSLVLTKEIVVFVRADQQRRWSELVGDTFTLGLRPVTPEVASSSLVGPLQ